MIFAPAATAQITENLYAIRTLMCNFYVYTDGTTSLCFDTGFMPPLGWLGLKRLGLDPKRISAVFLTHSDFDHAGGLGLFRKANLFLGEAEVPMITFRKARRWPLFNWILRKDFRPLKDGATVQIGKITVQAIHVPGHTPGSMAWLINGETLVTGDTLAVDKNGVRTFPVFMNMDTKTEMESIRKIRGINGVKRYCTGHYGVRELSGLPAGDKK